jgi:hypothetical protein
VLLLLLDGKNVMVDLDNEVLILVLVLVLGKNKSLGGLAGRRCHVEYK